MPATSEPVPTERGASDEAERDQMSIEIEDGDAEVKQAQQDAESADGASTSAAEEASVNASDEAGSAEEPASGADAEPAEEGEAAESEGDTSEKQPQEPAESADELVAKAQAEAKEWQDKFLRLHAEWDTYRRRTAEQREAEKARAAEKLVTGLLPVIDDFERTIDYADKNGEAGLLDGVRAVHSKFVDVLVKDGVEVIDPAGEPFDALEHQAVSTVPDEEAFDETVHDVYQKGYKLGEKVLRPAMVTVTVGGPKRPKEEASEEE